MCVCGNPRRHKRASSFWSPSSCLSLSFSLSFLLVFILILIPPPFRSTPHLLFFLAGPGQQREKKKTRTERRTLRKIGRGGGGGELVFLALGRTGWLHLFRGVFFSFFCVAIERAKRHRETEKRTAKKKRRQRTPSQKEKRNKNKKATTMAATATVKMCGGADGGGKREKKANGTGHRVGGGRRPCHNGTTAAGQKKDKPLKTSKIFVENDARRKKKTVPIRRTHSCSPTSTTSSTSTIVAPTSDSGCVLFIKKDCLLSFSHGIGCQSAPDTQENPSPTAKHETKHERFARNGTETRATPTTSTSPVSRCCCFCCCCCGMR